MALKFALEITEDVDMDRRDEYVRNMWRNLYSDYLAYLDESEMREAVNTRLTGADPDELLTNWTFVLFQLAHADFRANERRNERDFVVAMQTQGVVAYDPSREEDVYLHTG